MVNSLSLIAFLYWDPSPEMVSFHIPLLNRPILWYGFFFALGFFLGYGILLYLLRRFKHFSKKDAKITAEKISLYVVIGTIIGARLGDVLFYQSWKEILAHPLDVFKIWEGGLASHGGVIGVLIALYVLSKRIPKLGWIELLDLLAIPGVLAGCFIRIGNFFNQEILGTPTTVPWAVIFGHPIDGSPPLPRHPVQLYEALFYLLTALFLFLLWKRSDLAKREGKTIGLLLILLFSFRFFVEFFKMEQSVNLSSLSPLTMGQYLSVPFIFLGAFLFFRQKRLHRKG